MKKKDNYLLLTSVLAMTLFSASCQKEKNDQQTLSAQTDTKTDTMGGHFYHDPAHPPVDCPLRKAGLDPTKMKPFEQVEQYISFLEREDRALWQKPQEVVAALNLRGDELIFDLGAGSGYFTFPMAAKLNLGGRVIAGDPEGEMVRHIHHKTMSAGIKNIETAVIDSQKPTLPQNVDIVFMCDVLHHVAEPQAWLQHISGQMKSGSHFYMIEFKEGDIPQGPPEKAKIPRTRLLEMALKAGLQLDSEISDLLPYQYFLNFIKP